MPETGIIGGSGVYDPDLLENVAARKMSTPYGPPSAPVIVGTYRGEEMAFIPRHGPGHIIPPHKVNYRANIWTMKELGVKRLVSVSAVGSLREEYEPGQLVLADQFIDFTKNREYTFFDGNQVAHISTADPFCPEMRELAAQVATELGVPHQTSGTLVCVQGPRFSTRAESRMFRTFADIIGMTVVPEVTLAREAGMCYLTVAQITDYDVWKEKAVDVAEVISTMSANISNIRKILGELLPRLPEERGCGCGDALASATF